MSEKECRWCHTVKPLIDFSTHPYMADGHLNKCKCCESEANRQRYLKNAEKVKARMRDYNVVNRDTVNRKNNDRYHRTKTLKGGNWKYVDASGQPLPANVRRRMRTQAWRVKNPDKAVAHGENRRQLKLKAPGNGVSGKEWVEILKGFDHTCIYCGTKGTMTMDHLQPLYRGGAHDPMNVAPACGSCNSAKGTKSFVEYLAVRNVKSRAA